jgi:hypothetical protein
MAFALGCQVRVLHDYLGESDAELTLRRGEVVYYCMEDPRGWGKGQKMDGKRGWFPISFVAPLAQAVGRGRPPPVATRRSMSFSASPTQRPAVPPRKKPSPPNIAFSKSKDFKSVAEILDEWLPTRPEVPEAPFKISTSPRSTRKSTLLQALGLKGRSGHPNPVFGVTLSELQGYGRDIPLIVIQCFHYLTTSSKASRLNGVFSFLWQTVSILRVSFEFLGIEALWKSSVLSIETPMVS